MAHTERQAHSEQSTNPERLKLRLVKLLVISGPSHAGKDAATDELKRRHDWPVEDGKGRFGRKTGLETGHMQRSPETHRRFDGFQAKTFRTATPDDAMIWQTRLGGIILAKERDRRAKKIKENLWAIQRGENRPDIEPIPAVSVLLWARKEVRIERAFNAAILAWEEEVAKLPEWGEIPARPTKTDIKTRLEEREEGDIRDWAPLHKDYIELGKDPFSRTLQRKNGVPVYDVFIDTSDMSIVEVADAIEREVGKFGAYQSSFEIQGTTQSQSYSISSGEPMSPRNGVHR